MRIPIFSSRRQRSYVKAVHNGNWRRLLGARADDWQDFVSRTASIPHTDKVVLRLTHDDFYMWVVYNVVNTNPVQVACSRIFIPEDWNAAYMIPQGLVGLPVYEA